MINLGAWSPTPAVALGALLLAGHLLADFLFQTREHVESKRSGSGFIRHGSIVLAIHAVLVVPLWSGAVALAVAVITIAHVAIDWGKSRYLVPIMNPLTAFALDQAAHFLTVGAVWAATVTWSAPTILPGIESSSLGRLAAVALLAAAFAFNGTGGSELVEGVLSRLNPEREEGSGAGGIAGAGRLIGILERTLVLALVLYQQWAAMAILVTAKSIARFEELKKRRFAEYYLVGTLASLLVALAVAFLLTMLMPPLAT